MKEGQPDMLDLNMWWTIRRLREERNKKYYWFKTLVGSKGLEFVSPHFYEKTETNYLS